MKSEYDLMVENTLDQLKDQDDVFYAFSALIAAHEDGVKVVGGQVFREDADTIQLLCGHEMSSMITAVIQHIQRNTPEAKQLIKLCEDTEPVTAMMNSFNFKLPHDNHCVVAFTMSNLTSEEIPQEIRDRGYGVGLYFDGHAVEEDGFPFAGQLMASVLLGSIVDMCALEKSVVRNLTGGDKSCTH